MTMNKKIIFGVLLTTIIIILSSIPTIAEKNNQNLSHNIINEKFFQNINKISTIPWYPGFFITLLLAPFIILYIIIGIILDIGNP